MRPKDRRYHQRQNQHRDRESKRFIPLQKPNWCYPIRQRRRWIHHRFGKRIAGAYTYDAAASLERTVGNILSFELEDKFLLKGGVDGVHHMPLSLDLDFLDFSTTYEIGRLPCPYRKRRTRYFQVNAAYKTKDKKVQPVD